MFSKYTPYATAPDGYSTELYLLPSTRSRWHNAFFWDPQYIIVRIILQFVTVSNVIWCPIMTFNGTKAHFLGDPVPMVFSPSFSYPNMSYLPFFLIVSKPKFVLSYLHLTFQLLSFPLPSPYLPHIPFSALSNLVLPYLIHSFDLSPFLFLAFLSLFLPSVMKSLGFSNVVSLSYCYLLVQLTTSSSRMFFFLFPPSLSLAWCGVSRIFFSDDSGQSGTKNWSWNEHFVFILFWTRRICPDSLPNPSHLFFPRSSFTCTLVPWFLLLFLLLLSVILSIFLFLVSYIFLLIFSSSLLSFHSCSFLSFS